MALLRLNGVEEAKAYFGKKGLVQESKTVIQVTQPDGEVKTLNEEPNTEAKKMMVDLGCQFKKVKGTSKIYSMQEIYDALPARHAFISPAYRLWAFVYYGCALADVKAEFGEQSGRRAWNFKLLRTPNPGLADILKLIAYLKIPIEWVFGEKVTMKNIETWFGTTDSDSMETDTSDADVEADDAAAAADTDDTEEVTDTPQEVTTPVEASSEDESTTVEEDETEAPEVEASPSESQDVTEDSDEPDETVEEPAEELAEPTDLLAGDSDGDIAIDDFDTEKRPWEDDGEPVIEDDSGPVELDLAESEVTGPQMNVHGLDDVDGDLEDFLT